MTNAEIGAMIRKYDLVRKGDKVGTYKRGIDPDALRAEVAPHKAEILAYMEAQEAEAAARVARRHETFDAIPGVREIRAAREDNAKWRKEFNHMMDTGSSVMRPGVVLHSEEEMSDLEAKYPHAVIALEIQRRANISEDIGLHEIYSKAYNAICDGADIDETKAAMDAELKANSERHMWD